MQWRQGRFLNHDSVDRAGWGGGWFWEHGRWPALVAFSLVLLVGALALALRLRRLAPI